MTPSVQCLQYYVMCHFWTLICNVLGYWRHHSICYTSLFTTPLVVTTVSGYNVLWPSDVVSRSGLFSVIYSVISFGVFISVSLLYLSSFSVCCVLCYISLLCLSSHLSLSVHLSFSGCLFYLSPLKYSVCVWNRRHIFSQLHFLLLLFRKSLVA
jgi:hypothetical protein